MANKQAELEALLFVAGDEGVQQTDLCNLLAVRLPALRELVTSLAKKYKQDQHSGLQLLHINSLYKLTTSPQVSKVVANYFTKDLSKSLSQSALEILAIVAYRQPITRVEIDSIRGVHSAGALQTLVWRGLVRTNGQKNAPGHPNVYITTDYFLQYFNYHSLDDLPAIDNFTDKDHSSNKVDLFSQRGQADHNLRQLKKGEKK